MALVKTVTVEEEMKKNSELKKSDLEMLRDWLKKQPHLPPMSDSELVLFLHSNYYRIEPTKTTIDVFFTARTHIPEFFSGRDPLGTKELREVMKVSCSLPLASTTPEGYKLIFNKLLDYEPSHYVPADALKLFSMVMDLWLTTGGTSPGYVIVIDVEGFAFGHIPRISLMLIKKVVYYVQEALPIRLKAIHIMNTIPLVDLILNMAKPFMKKELMDMLHFHKNLNSLSEKVPIDLLPNDQGGKAGVLKDLWAVQLKELEDHRAWFQNEETRHVNESARPGKAKNATDLFGFEGSFKKLDID